MSSHENFYTTTQTGSRPVSQSFGLSNDTVLQTPPPPPPKPLAQTHSKDPSRTGTPTFNSSQPGLPPLPPTPGVSNSPRPQPPLPTSPHPITSSAPTYPPDPMLSIPPPSFSAHWLPTAPDLQSYTTSDLTHILSDPPLLNALASSHPSEASALVPIQSQLNANVALATQLSNLEAQITHLRTATQQLLLHHTTLTTQWRRKQSEMDNALSPWGPRAMYQRLVSSINEQESVLKAMQESFLEGGGDDEYYGVSGNGASGGKASEKDVSEWIRRIKEGTTVLEKRREMRARWDEGRVGGWR